MLEPSARTCGVREVSRCWQAGSELLPRYPAEFTARTGVPIADGALAELQKEGLTHFWRFRRPYQGDGQAAASSVVCLITGALLNAAQTPTYGSPSGFPGLGFLFEGVANDRFQAASAASYDQDYSEENATGWLAWITPHTGNATAAQRSIGGKSVSSTDTWRLNMQTEIRRPQMNVNNGSAFNATPTNPGALVDLPMVCYWGFALDNEPGSPTILSCGYRTARGEEAQDVQAGPSAAVGVGTTFRVGGHNTPGFGDIKLLLRLHSRANNEAIAPATAAGIQALLRKCQPWC